MSAILSIQSHVAYGYVGNRAATFPLQSMGYDVIAVNTVQFSNHTGYGDWRGQVFGEAHIDDILNGLKARNVLKDIRAVVTGYLGDAALGEIILKHIDEIRAENPELIWLCDPVMGDVGRGFFVRENIPDFFKNQAIHNAQIMTPNMFELEALTGIKANSLSDIRQSCQLLHAAGVQNVLVTSVETHDIPDNRIAMIMSDRQANVYYVDTPKIDINPAPNGAGDLTAALFLGVMLELSDTVKAFEITAEILWRVFEWTQKSGHRELSLIKARALFQNPALIAPENPAIRL